MIHKFHLTLLFIESHFIISLNRNILTTLNYFTLSAEKKTNRQKLRHILNCREKTIISAYSMRKKHVSRKSSNRGGEGGI